MDDQVILGSGLVVKLGVPGYDNVTLWGIEGQLLCVTTVSKYIIARSFISNRELGHPYLVKMSTVPLIINKFVSKLEYLIRNYLHNYIYITVVKGDKSIHPS